MEHLLEAPPLVHRDHREAARVVRNLLEAAQFSYRNTHSCHHDGSQKGPGHIDLCGSNPGGSGLPPGQVLLCEERLKASCGLFRAMPKMRATVRRWGSSLG